MISLFADTFYWIAFADVRDSAHQRALKFTSHHAGLIVTTDEVLVEFLTYFADSPGRLRSRALAIVRRVLSNSRILVVPQSRESFLSGLALYESRPDKNYSLTDCISMQTMRRGGITDALTNDRHFEQEGFRALFRDMESC